MTLMLSATIFYSCSRDETPEEKKELEQDKSVEDWENEDINGDATMSSRVIQFSVDSIPSVTRGVTPFDGKSYSFSVGDRITIEMYRGSTKVGTKVYKVKNASGLLEFDDTGLPFAWENKSETVKLRAWSYGTSTAFTTEPKDNSFTLNTDQKLVDSKENYKELLYSPQQEYDYSANVALRLYHQMARLTVTLTNTKATALSVTANSVIIGDGTLPISADFSEDGIDIDNSDFIGSWTDPVAGDGTTGKVIARTDDDNSKYSAVLFPGTITSGKKLITLTTTDGTFAYTLPSNITLQPGCQYNYSINVRDLVAVSTLTIGSISDYTYNGTAREPTPTVTDPVSGKELTLGTHYTLSYSNNTNAGTATCTVTGLGIYSGTQSKTFTINPLPVTLSFAASTETVDYIWNQTKYVLTKSLSDATVTFSSSNTNLVNVNSSTGVLTAGSSLVSSGTATITAQATGNYTSSAVTYTVTTRNYKDFSYNGVSSGGYDGSVQSISLPKATYRMECWGAQGGSPDDDSQSRWGGVRGGYGGYVAGNIENPSTRTFFVYVGGQSIPGYNHSTATVFNGGWNGGGAARGGQGGGGATDVRLTSGDWNNLTSLCSRILVAGGGGGWDCGRGGEAGGLIGYTGYVGQGSNSEGTGSGGTALGGKQDDGGSGALAKGGFGQGGSADGESGGGGSGWYGGGKCGVANQSGGGGSSYISGHAGCIANASSTAVSPSTAGSDNSVERSKHLTGLFFTNTLMIDGAGYKWTTEKQSLYAMPNPSGGNYASGVGRDGHGYARISFVSQ